MRYVIPILCLAIVGIYFLWRRLKKPVVQIRTLRLLTFLPTTMKVGERFQIEYDVVNLPSEKPVSATVYWRVQPGEEVPPGSPDFPVIYVDAGAKITAMNPGERLIYATFSDEPDVQVTSFRIKVIT